MSSVKLLNFRSPAQTAERALRFYNGPALFSRELRIEIRIEKIRHRHQKSLGARSAAGPAVMGIIICIPRLLSPIDIFGDYRYIVGKMVVYRVNSAARP